MISSSTSSNNCLITCENQNLKGVGGGGGRGVTRYNGLYGATPPQKGYPFSGFRYLKLYGKDFSIPYYMKFSRQVNFVNFAIQKKRTRT